MFPSENKYKKGDCNGNYYFSLFYLTSPYSALRLRLLTFSSDCPHSTLMKDMCADCGADLRKEESPSDTMTENSQQQQQQQQQQQFGGKGSNNSGQGEKSKASISMVHSIPELKVSNDVSSQVNKCSSNRSL